MPFSHHSHSGQFCGHATNTLEEIVQNALRRKITTLCLTEHIPRQRIDFYPREEEEHTETSLHQLFDDFHHEARRLQEAYEDRIQLFVGFESEWIRRPASLAIIEDLLARYEWELFVGSVHHVHTVPIDYDTPMYHRAREVAGGSDERIFEDYFDAQYDMLKALKPPVVGHFDLIRLKSDEPDRSLKTYGSGLWEKVLRNLKFVADYGGVLELNSSSLRKGMMEPYPAVYICKEFKAMDGRFTLSDDSHGTEQVGLKYGKVLECAKKAGITELCCLARKSPRAPHGIQAHDQRFPFVGWKVVDVAELEKHAFWTT